MGVCVIFYPDDTTRPDWYRLGHSVEVKNYDVESENGIDRLAGC